MKNLLIYTGPSKKFTHEDEMLARIQIDNSLDLGWKKDEILLVTNFPYSYNGVGSHQIGDIYYDFDLAASKLPVMIHLIKNSIIDNQSLYWCHDFDAFELNKINEVELGLKHHNLGLVPYYYKPEWSFSSVFLKNMASPIFELIDSTTKKYPRPSRNNEKALAWLIKHDMVKKESFVTLNVTYNIAKRCLKTVYEVAEKPIKVLHFRPSDPKDKMMPDTALNMFMYGKNRLKIPLMNARLIKVFNYHGIK